MKRREFIVGCAAGAAAAAFGAKSGEKPLLEKAKIPEWAEREIAETFARYREWRGSDEAAAFPYVTDLHSRMMELPKDFADFSNTQMHVLLAQRAADVFRADFMADLGDVDLDMSVRVSPPGAHPPKFKPCPIEDVPKRVAVHGAFYRHWGRPVLFAMGNHDHSHGRYSSREFGQFFNAGITKAQGHPTALSEDGDYGYLDLPGKKTRAIFLNSSDGAYYGYSVKQLKFFAEALGTMESGWTAVAMQHFCIVHSIGHWKSWPNVRAKRGDAAIAIAEAFAAGAKGSAEGAEWDFTKAKSRAFAGFFFGDSHFDHHLVKNGIAYTISQGYGGVGKNELPEGAHLTPWFDRRKQMLVDVVAIKPAKREVRIFRIGAGGKERDRGYVY